MKNITLNVNIVFDSDRMSNILPQTSQPRELFLLLKHLHLCGVHQEYKEVEDALNSSKSRDCREFMKLLVSSNREVCLKALDAINRFSNPGLTNLVELFEFTKKLCNTNHTTDEYIGSTSNDSIKYTIHTSMGESFVKKKIPQHVVRLATLKMRAEFDPIPAPVYDEKSDQFLFRFDIDHGELEIDIATKSIIFRRHGIEFVYKSIYDFGRS